MRSFYVRLADGAWLAAVLVLVAASGRAQTIEACIAEALKANPDVQVAAARLDAAAAAIDAAKSAYYPQVTAAVGYSRTDNAGQALFMALNQRDLSMASDLNHPADTGNARASLTARYLLADGGQRRLGHEMAKLGLAATAAGREAVYNELIHQVCRGYYGALQARAFISVREQTVGSLGENLRVAQERVKAGTAVRSDVLNLEVKLAEANEDLIRARNGLELAVAALNTTIGSEIAKADALPAAPAVVLAPVAEPYPTGAEANRPELLAAQLATQVRGAAWQKARGDYLPRLSAFASGDFDTSGNSPVEPSYMAGVMLEWDLFTGFRRGAAAAAARAEVVAAQAEETKARNQLRFDLRQAFIQRKEARERLDVARRSAASADEALRITRERYQKGAADITELLTAEVGLSATRTRTVAAEYDGLIADANLARAKGDLGRKYTPGTATAPAPLAP